MTHCLAAVAVGLVLLAGCGEASGQVSGVAEEPSSSAASSPREVTVYYRTAWPPGAFLGGWLNVDGGTIGVLLADASLQERPAPLDEAEARASIQQVVYTLQEYAGDCLPVRFPLDDQMVDRVLGVRTAEPVTADSRTIVVQ